MREYKNGFKGGPESLEGTNTSSAECEASDELLLKVSTDTNGNGTLPVRIHLEETPAVKNLADLPGPAKEPKWEDLRVDKATGAPEYGATSFKDAKVLEPGSYPVAITLGESQVYAVDLDWGQHLQVQADLETVQDRFLSWQTRVLSPFGSDAAVNDSERYNFGSAKEMSLKARTYPIRYKNSGETYANENSVPGRYYVIISGGNREDAGEKQAEAKGTMTLEVVGEAGEGKPEFADMEEKSDRADENKEVDAKDAAAAEEDSGMNWPVIAAVAVGLIVLLIVIALVMGRRKKS